ncbi:hypothetical protein N499_0508 [Wolbachia pipientis wVitA]|nr:hypothetical protein N499_0508 [Wolbachia pipientis wVitA]
MFVSGMFSGSSKKFHIILSDFKIFFATREAPIASGKRLQVIPCTFSQFSGTSGKSKNIYLIF